MPESVDLELLYHTHQAALRGRARRLTGTDHDADDLVQATFERSLRRLATLQPGTRAGSWLATIMNRLFIDDWRKRQRSPQPVAPSELEVAAPEPEALLWWHGLTREELWSAAAELPAYLREVLEGHVIDGLTYAALANRMGTRPSTIGSRLSRTRERLRAVLVERHQRGEPRYSRRQ
jgi:RNA polymerase sigma-70 factor, ECF subfamily